MADDDEEVTPERHAWVLLRSDGFGVTSLAAAAEQLQTLSLGQTATLEQRGVPHNDPAGRVGISRVLDGWVVTCAARPEPAWVGTFRDLLTAVNEHPASEREDR